MIVRATDASFHNYVANHPTVKPTLGYNEDYTDFTPLFEHPELYTLLHDEVGAASIFEWSAPGVWQAHSLFLPESRGRNGIETGKAMLAWMFEHGARMVWGQTPIDNRAARMFNRLIGGKSDGKGHHFMAGPVEYFVFERERNAS